MNSSYGQKTKKGWLIVIFLLLYYVYFNAVKTVMIPFNSITIPLIILISILYTLSQNTQIRTLSDRYRSSFMYVWVIIGIYIFVNNSDISYTLIKGGMIQTYAMILFLVLSLDCDEWVAMWIKLTKIYAIIYAISTILFYFMPALYYTFVLRMFEPDTQYSVLSYYNKGWNCGLCSHFSTNGMIISTGLILFFEDIKHHIEENDFSFFNKIWSLTLTFIMLYGLILTSKRSPMIAAIAAVSFAYVLSSRKGLFKRVVFYLLFLGILYLLYTIAVDTIPGLETLAVKTESLSDSDAGVLNGRMELWDLAWKMFEDNPLFGQGFGSYSVEAQRTGMFTLSAHNYYLQVMAELGIVGLILYLIVFLSSLFYAIRVLRRLESVSGYVNNKDIFSTRVSVEIQIFVLLYNLTATGMMYYQVLIPYFIACTVPCIMHYKNYGTMQCLTNNDN